MKGKPTRKQFQMQLDQMVSELRNEIMEGKYAADKYLPSEPTLVERFQLSNKSVRKGLDILVGEGLIEKIHRVGSRVKAQRPPVTITLACTGSIARDLNLDRLLEDFHQLHPWIRVKTILSVFKGGIGYDLIDVMTMNHLHFCELAESGGIEMLEPVPVHPDTYAMLTEAYTIDGTQYAQPLVFSPIVLCYNKEHFRESGLPEPDGGWTWDDLVRSAELLSQKNGRYGLYFHLPSENRWPVFLLQSGEKFEWDGIRLRDIRGTKLLEGIRLCKSIIRNRDIVPLYLSDSSSDSQALFTEGKVSMILSNYMSLNDFKDTDLPYDISPVPFMHEPRTLLLSIGVGVNKYSRQKEAAHALVSYLGSPRAQQLIRQETLSIPANRPAAESEAETGLNGPSRYGLFREMRFSYRKHNDLNVSISSIYAMVGVLKAYWSDMIDEETLCDRLAELLVAPESAYGQQ